MDLLRSISWLLARVGIAGRQPTRQSDRLAIKPLLNFYKNVPLGKSIDDVSRGLAKCAVYIATEIRHEPGQPIMMKSDNDKYGGLWAYIYTDEAELQTAFPQGTPFLKMRFGSVFRIVERDSRFGGIFINHTREYTYLIPRPIFDDVRAVLDSHPEWEKAPLD
jgi:hypothetical protein